MNEGIVFSVLRGSLYDGPGIRTTVFLKGCNLRCLWCHNPEGIAQQPQLAYRAHQCIGCKACANACEAGTHFLKEIQHSVDFSVCQACAKCVQCCPTGALQLYGKTTTVQEIMQVVLKDKHYYKPEGGLTLSGGEPLLQADFVLSLLQEAKKENVHTCVETAGCVSQNVLKKIMPYTDLFLFDYKATGAKEHKRLTGVNNKLILKNLNFLYTNNAKIRLRCPIVPGCNDTQTHFAGIASIAKQYATLDAVEIMPYHDMGVSKSTFLGQTAPFVAKTTTAAQKQAWMQTLQNMGAVGIQMNE